MGQPEEEVYAKTRKKRRDKGRNPQRMVSWKPRERVFPGGSSHASLMLQTDQVRCRSSTSTSISNSEAVSNLDEHHQGRVIKQETRGGDDSFRKFGGEWGESAKVYIVSFDPQPPYDIGPSILQIRKNEAERG